MPDGDRLVFQALAANRHRAALRFDTEVTEVELEEDALAWRPHGREPRTLRLDGLQQVLFLDHGDGTGAFVALPTGGAPVELPVRWRRDAADGLPDRARALADRATARARALTGAQGPLPWNPDEPVFPFRLKKVPRVRIMREDLDGMVLRMHAYPGWGGILVNLGVAMYPASICAGAVSAWAVLAVVLLATALVVAAVNSLRGLVTVTLRQAGLTVRHRTRVHIPYTALERVELLGPDGETLGGRSRVTLRFVRKDGPPHEVGLATGGPDDARVQDIERLVAQIGWMAGRTSRDDEVPEGIEALRRGRAVEGQSR